MTFKFLVGDVVRYVRDHPQQVGTELKVTRVTPGMNICLEGDGGWIYAPNRFTLIERSWTKWESGDNPVPGMQVDILFQSGHILINKSSDELNWRRVGDRNAFTEYRVPRQAVTNTVVEVPNATETVALKDLLKGDRVTVCIQGVVRKVFSDSSGLYLEDAAGEHLQVDASAIAYIRRDVQPLKFGDWVTHNELAQSDENKGLILGKTTTGAWVVEWATGSISATDEGRLSRA